MKAILALEDGKIFEGVSFGASGECLGEVVFNTSMTGYQEILTDPSYKGQIVTMTYPQIGNYGVNPEDIESRKPQVEGFIVRENSRIYSNWRGRDSLDNYLKRHNIIGLEEVDTRAIVRHIRIFGAMKGIISTIDLDKESLIKKAKEFEGIVGVDLVKKVTCKEKYIWSDKKYKVVAMDFGVKYNILKYLSENNCGVIVVPADTSYQEILDYNPDGIFLSNGPGDPAPITYAIKTVERLIEKKPIFGICLGHQILALAMGEETYKLKFGHRGGNQPVKDLKTGKIEITAQNHGFCVRLKNNSGLYPTHINLNDDTLEGMAHKELPLFSVQYHPEASPGPHDASYLFKRFIELMERERNRGNGL
jgi:carbamoyl-phosphate synthase small subunit